MKEVVLPSEILELLRPHSGAITEFIAAQLERRPNLQQQLGMMILYTDVITQFLGLFPKERHLQDILSRLLDLLLPILSFSSAENTEEEIGRKVQVMKCLNTMSAYSATEAGDNEGMSCIRMYPANASCLLSTFGGYSS